jgi:hypothetical protein
MLSKVLVELSDEKENDNSYPDVHLCLDIPVDPQRGSKG